MSRHILKRSRSKSKMRPRSKRISRVMKRNKSVSRRRRPLRRSRQQRVGTASLMSKIKRDTLVNQEVENAKYRQDNDGEAPPWITYRQDIIKNGEELPPWLQECDICMWKTDQDVCTKECMKKTTTSIGYGARRALSSLKRAPGKIIDGVLSVPKMIGSGAKSLAKGAGSATKDIGQDVAGNMVFGNLYGDYDQAKWEYNKVNEYLDEEEKKEQIRKVRQQAVANILDVTIPAGKKSGDYFTVTVATNGKTKTARLKVPPGYGGGDTTAMDLRSGVSQ